MLKKELITKVKEQEEDLADLLKNLEHLENLLLRILVWD